MLRILVADDHQIVRQSLRALLERERFEVVGEAADGHEAIRLARETQPDIAVLDSAMPLLNGLAAAREIHQVSPRTRSILLAVHTESWRLLEALRMGLQGYVVKTQAAADLIEAIREVSRGLIYPGPSVSTAANGYLRQGAAPADPLTPREREVLQLIAEGKATKEIAGLLGVSVKTAESHRIRIMDKLDIHQVAGLVRYAIRRGVIQP